jgi:hypothetical protein
MTDVEKINDIDLELIDGGLDNDDFVYTQVKGDDGSVEIVGGGYKVNSFFMKAGMPIMTTTSTFDNAQKGGEKKVSTPFENLAVPAGLFYVSQRIPKHKEEHYTPHEMLPDNIFDKLYALVDGSKKAHKKTRKNTIKITNKRKSKRNMV